MSEYDNYYNEHLDISFDHHLNQLCERGLVWLPWVGKTYDKSAGRILIVGESNYTDEPDILKVPGKKAEISNNKKHTREVIAEYPILADWGGKKSATFDNLHRVLLRTALLKPDELKKRCLLWSQISFYNLVQYPMDYGNGRRERPDSNAYYEGWKIFVRVLEVLKPKTCIFVGVQASNTFNQAMRKMEIKHTVINLKESLNGVYTRADGSVTVEGLTTNIIFIKHTSSFFRWESWNEYLERIIPENMVYLREVVLDGKQPK